LREREGEAKCGRRRRLERAATEEGQDVAEEDDGEQGDADVDE